MAGSANGEAAARASGLRGVIYAAVTPFTASGEVDYQAFAEVLSFLADQRPSAIVIAMDVGEGISLRDTERKSVAKFAARTLAGRTKLVVDVSMAGTMLAADQARHAEASGADAVLMTTPYYWRPPEPQLVEHFSHVAASTSLPVLLHNSPRTHKQHMHEMRFTPSILTKLFERAPNIVGMADGSLHLVYFTQIRRFTTQVRPGFLLFTDEAFMTSSAALGGDGAVSALGGVVPEMVRELHGMCERQEYIEARDLQREIGRVWRLMRSGSLPANVKAAMGLMDRPVGRPRLPNLPVDEDGIDQLRAELDAIGVFGRARAGWSSSQAARPAA